MKYPDIDPVLFSLGPLQLRWYGLMYVLGFVAAWLLVAWQVKRLDWKELAKHLDTLNLCLILGVILGGRLGYVLFYNLGHYLRHPLEIPATWAGGMSFHGGCLGVLLAGWWYCRRQGLDFWKVADLYVVTVPIGLFLGRIGNFINGELFGRESTVPWAMVFPEGGPLPRHPSQLYECFCEGVLLFVLLWLLKDRPWREPPQRLWPHGSMLACFLVAYGGLRFVVEYTREPDLHLGLLWLNLSMGQWLCLAMMVLGGGLWLWRSRGVSLTQKPASLHSARQHGAGKKSK